MSGEVLAEQMLLIEDDNVRRKTLESAMRAWEPSVRRERAGELNEAFVWRAEKVQAEAIETHKNGGETTGAEADIRKLVDMIVGMQVILKRIEDSEKRA